MRTLLFIVGIVIVLASFWWMLMVDDWKAILAVLTSMLGAYVIAFSKRPMIAEDLVDYWK